MKDRKLTQKQRVFVAEYLSDLNATKAAIRAGYSERTATRIGPELLGKTCVAAAIEKAMEEREKRTSITQDYVVTTIHDTIERCRKTKGFDPRSIMKGCELLGKHLGIFEKDNSQKTPKFEHVEVTLIATNIKG